MDLSDLTPEQLARHEHIASLCGGMPSDLEVEESLERVLALASEEEGCLADDALTLIRKVLCFVFLLAIPGMCAVALVAYNSYV